MKIEYADENETVAILDLWSGQWLRLPGQSAPLILAAEGCLLIDARTGEHRHVDSDMRVVPIDAPEIPEVQLIPYSDVVLGQVFRVPGGCSLYLATTDGSINLATGVALERGPSRVELVQARVVVEPG